MLHLQKWEHCLPVSFGNPRALNLSLIWAATLSITRPGYEKPFSACSYHSGTVCLPQVCDWQLTLRSPNSCFFEQKSVHHLPSLTIVLFLSHYKDSWADLCSSVFSYATQVPLTDHSQPLLMSRLKNLLERVRLKGKLSPETMCFDFTWIPWDNIVLVCIDQKLRDWHIPGPPDYEGEDICYSYYTSHYIWWPV